MKNEAVGAMSDLNTRISTLIKERESEAAALQTSPDRFQGPSRKGAPGSAISKETLAEFNEIFDE